MSKNIDPKEVEQVMQEVRASISQYVEFALDPSKDEEARANQGQEKIDSTRHSLKLVTDLLGLDTEKFFQDPGAIQQNLLQLMSGLGSIAQVFEGSNLQSPEDLQASLEKLDQNFKAEGLDFEALLKDLPEELSSELKGADLEERAQQMQTRAVAFTQALQELLRNKELSPEQLFAGLEQLATDFGFRQEVEEGPITIDDDVQKRLNERLDKKLENLDMDFSYDALFGKSAQEPKE